MCSVQKDSPTNFTLLVASVNTSSETHEFEIGNNKGELTVKYGDYSADMAKVNEALKKVRIRNYLLRLRSSKTVTRRRNLRQMNIRQPCWKATLNRK